MTLCIGFTGTRHGMSTWQSKMVEYTIVHLVDSSAREFGFFAHHGDCVGADAEFHAIIRKHYPTAKIVIHPGPDPDSSLVAHCRGDERLEPAPHMKRNLAIVTRSTVVIAAPHSATLHVGGTWKTIGMAQRARTLRPLCIVMPDGSRKMERWP